MHAFWRSGGLHLLSSAGSAPFFLLLAWLRRAYEAVLKRIHLALSISCADRQYPPPSSARGVLFGTMFAVRTLAGREIVLMRAFQPGDGAVLLSSCLSHGFSSCFGRSSGGGFECQSRHGCRLFQERGRSVCYLCSGGVKLPLCPSESPLAGSQHLRVLLYRQPGSA